MDSVRISASDLAYYEQLERTLASLHHILEDCRCIGWCDHKYMLRRTVSEIQSCIERHRALRHPIEQLLPAQVLADLRLLDKPRSDWARSSGSMNLPGPETP
jgi:hypothetical protein